MEDKRAFLYRYNDTKGRWGFVPIPDSDMGNEKASLKPIETWTTLKGEIVTLCDCTYSIVAVREMMNMENDPSGAIYPPILKPNTKVVICLAQEKSKSGNTIVCMVRRPIETDSALMELISRNHSQGCEPRYGQTSAGWSLSQIKENIQGTAILNVISTEIHEKDWTLFIQV